MCQLRHHSHPWKSKAGNLVRCLVVCSICSTQNICLHFVSQFSEFALKTKCFYFTTGRKPLGTADIVHFAFLHPLVFRLRTVYVAVGNYLARQGVLLTSVGRVCELYRVQTGCSCSSTRSGVPH